MKREGWRKDEFNNCLSSAAGNKCFLITTFSHISISIRYIRFSLKHSPSLSPLSYLTLSLVQACSQPHAHHKYKATHTREGSCRDCQTVTHRPSVWKRVDSLGRFPTHLQQQIQEPPVNFYTAAASCCNFTHTHMHRSHQSNTLSWQFIIRSQCTGCLHAFSGFKHPHAISTHDFWLISAALIYMQIHTLHQTQRLSSSCLSITLSNKMTSLTNDIMGRCISGKTPLSRLVTYSIWWNDSVTFSPRITQLQVRSLRYGAVVTGAIHHSEPGRWYSLHLPVHY